MFDRQLTAPIIVLAIPLVFVISHYKFGEAIGTTGMLETRISRSGKRKTGLTNARNVFTSYRRSYPQSIEAVSRARRDVVDFAKDSGFSGQTLCDIEVAVGEGLANAVEHGNRSSGGFDVFVWRDAGALVVEIKDGGSGFDHGTLPASAAPPIDALRGFGVFIMRALMDEIHYTEFGTRLRLLKRLPSADGSRERAALRV